VMMIGELEFEDMFYEPKEEDCRDDSSPCDTSSQIPHPVTTHLMFFTFVILVTVILMNLLVGLAVSDIQGLQASAGLNRLSRQAELVARLESLLFSKLLKKTPPRLLGFLRREALLRTSRYNLQLGIKPNDPREKTVRKMTKVLMLFDSMIILVAERYHGIDIQARC
jgi:hypothetical protein